MAKPDRAVAVRAILEVFNEEANAEAFKRMLFDEAARDIKTFYKEFVMPVMPKDMKIEVEGNIGVTDLKGLLGEAIVIDAECSDNVIVPKIEAPKSIEYTGTGINSPSPYVAPAPRFPLEEIS